MDLKKLTASLIAATSLAFVTACGGGGSSGGAVATPTPSAGGTATPSNWEFGVFRSSSEFRNRCAAPRGGQDPLTNRPYPDVQGTLEDEMLWIRSHMNETYLWRDEIDDADPADFEDPQSYFDQLRTKELLPSGARKDRDSFSQSSERDAEQRASTGFGFGIEPWFLRSPAGRTVFLVAFSYPGSPAATGSPSLPRGTLIHTINGLGACHGAKRCFSRGDPGCLVGRGVR